MTTQMTHPTDDDLAAFDTGALPAEAHAAIERHVIRCDACCRFLERLPETPLAARLREFTRAVTLGDDGTSRDSAPPSASLPAEIPDELARHPRFQILGLVGTGATGAVYRATQRPLDRLVAVKVLHRQLTDRPGFAKRFHREMQALARLNHANIVQAYDADRAGDSHFLVMEFVAGESLDSLVRRRGPLPAPEACDLLRQAAVGLQQAHERQLVHRDIKPGNLLVTKEGVVKIADFGLARLVGTVEPAEPGSAPTLLGTPEYMAPEQARDPARADIRSDLYSLGCTLYFLLTGTPPFSGTSHLQTLLDHQDANPRPLTGAPWEVEAVVRRLLAKEPARRFATPAEAAEAIARASGSGVPLTVPARWRRWRVVALAAGVVLAAVAAGVGLTDARDPPAEAQAVGTREPAEQTPSNGVTAPEPRAVDRDRRATVEEVAASRRVRADELVEWVRANNRWKPEAEISLATARRVESALQKADGFVLAFGGGLLKSGNPTLVAARPGGFFVFELTPEQARGAGLTAMGHVFASHAHAADPRRRIPRVVLSDLRLDAADAHSAASRVNGEVACGFSTPPGPGDHLRVTHYRSDGRRVTYLHYPKPMPARERVVVRFSANPIESDRPKAERLVPIFVEWASRDGADDVIESDTVASLLLFRSDR